MKERIDEILLFWFGPRERWDDLPNESTAYWWKKDPDFDAEVKERFEADLLAAEAGERDEWKSSAEGKLALIILMDQLSRNMFRGTADMYRFDERACALAHQLIDSGQHNELHPIQRYFVYMPLMHSEELADQELCVELFKQLTEDAGERFARAVDFAVKHRDIVADWGRFPHRNEILGRETTPEEAEFLKTPGSSF